MDKNTVIIIASIFFALLLALMTGSMWVSRIEARLDQQSEHIEKRMTEIDGRRNAQYGILKRKLDNK